MRVTEDSIGKLKMFVNSLAYYLLAFLNWRAHTFWHVAHKRTNYRHYYPRSGLVCGVNKINETSKTPETGSFYCERTT